MFHRILCVAYLLAFPLPAVAQTRSVEGDWRTQGGWATIRIAPCVSNTNLLCGTIVALRRANGSDGQPLRDTANPNAALRHRPLVGLPFLSDFRAAGAGRWSGGSIYDPDSGHTYGSNMRLKADGGLEVNGCVLFICRAQNWTRVTP